MEAAIPGSRAIPSSSPAAEPKASNLKSPSQVRLATLPSLRAERHANSQFLKPPAHRVRSHSKDAGDRQHRAHHAQHAERHRRHTRRKQNDLQHAVPGLSLNGQPCVQLAQFTPDSRGKMLRIVCGAHHQTRPHSMAIGGTGEKSLAVDLRSGSDIFRLQQYPRFVRAFHPAI